MGQRLAGSRNAARAFSASEKVADLILGGERWLLDRAPVGCEGIASAQLEPELDQLNKRQYARHLQKAQFGRAAEDIALDVDKAGRRDLLGKVARYGADGASPSLLGREHVNGPIADCGEALRQRGASYREIPKAEGVFDGDSLLISDWLRRYRRAEVWDKAIIGDLVSSAGRRIEMRTDIPAV